ncbi:unnamed protein product [Symbiodinium sp. CCMP2456]|nr:unnamed protein product [Symbiodinium sp. CCMP2456]
MRQAAGTVDTWSDEQAFSFGIANSGGRYEICYCANYDTSERTNSYDAASGAYTACDSDAEFTHSAGALIATWYCVFGSGVCRLTVAVSGT